MIVMNDDDDCLLLSAKMILLHPAEVDLPISNGSLGELLVGYLHDGCSVLVGLRPSRCLHHCQSLSISVRQRSNLVYIDRGR